MKTFEDEFKEFEKVLNKGIEVTLSMKKVDGDKIGCTIQGSVNSKSLVCLAIISSLAQVMGVDANALIDLLADNAEYLREEKEEEDQIASDELTEALKALGIEAEEQPARTVKTETTEHPECEDDAGIEELARIIAKAIKNEM